MSGLHSVSDDGFSLLELLIVIALTGIISALGINAFRQVDQTWRQLSDHAAEGTNVDAARELLTNVLSQCYPFVTLDRDHRPTLSFHGGPKAMAFLAPLREALGAADIVQYRLIITAEGMLVLDWRMDRKNDNGEQSGNWIRTIIVAGVGKASFGFYGVTSESSNGQWAASWDNAKSLPELIAVPLPSLSAGSGLRNVVVETFTTALFCDLSARTQCQ